MTKKKNWNDTVQYVTIVREIIIDGVSRALFPINFDFLLLKGMRFQKRLVAQRNKLNNLTLYMQQLRNTYIEEARGYTLFEFGRYLSIMLGLLPERFYEIERYIPDMTISNSLIVVVILKIKPEGIAYLEKHYPIYRHEISVLKKLMKEKPYTFDKDIDELYQKVYK